MINASDSTSMVRPAETSTISGARGPGRVQALTIALLLCAGSLFAQTEVGDHDRRYSPEGLNLGGVVSWNPALVFTDAMKHARPWIPQAPWPAPWNTGVPLALTADGWPLPVAGQWAGTLMLDNRAGRYPAGRYVCLFDGTGTITVDWDATIVGTSPGRLEIDVTPSNAGILLRVTSSDPADPLRNIRFLLPGFEATHATSDRFHPAHRAMLDHFGVIRFMDWGRTNNSPVVTWADRTPPSFFSEGTERGVSIEAMIDLANERGAEPWFCVPHQADDDYVRQLARLILARLDPQLRAWIEYSNETWNSTFQQAAYCEAQGLMRGLSTNPFQARLRFSSERSVEIFSIFAQEWGNTSRLVRVLASQSANPWTAEQTLDWRNAAAQADVLALAPYFGGHLGSSSMGPTVAGWTTAQVLDACETQIQGSLRSQVAQNVTLARNAGLEVVAYEFGQHLVAASSLHSNQALIDLFIATNREARMGEVYRRYHEMWTQEGGGLACWFSSVGQPSIWGSWGMLEYQTQPASQAPKWQAVQDIIAATHPQWRFGTQCGLALGAEGLPAIAGPSSFTLLGAGAPPGAPSVLALGLQADQWMGTQLPIDLGPGGAPGCWMNVALDGSLALAADAQGEFALTITAPVGIPAGTRVYWQWGVQDVAANPLGLRTSNGLRTALLP